jgi:hypothetical protein
MALTFSRWMTAVVAGCLIIAATFLAPRRIKPRSQDARWPLYQREMFASAASLEAATKLRAIELRDSLLPLLDRSPRNATSRVIMSSALPPAAMPLITVLRARTEIIRTREAVAPIDIAFVSDTASSVRGRPIVQSRFQVTHVLPPASGGRCLAIGRFRQAAEWYGTGGSWWRSYVTSAEMADRLLGPCAFYEAFGAPGQEINKWLTNGGWKYGKSGALAYRPGRWTQNAYYWATPMWGLAAGWPLRRYITPTGFRCASGDAATCRALVLDPNSDRAARTVVRSGADRVITQIASDEWTNSLGPWEPSFLARMAHAIGTEQFRRFWTSNLPPAEAFRAVTGQDLGEWTAAWASEAYGRQRRGAGVDASSAGWAVVLAILALGGAMVSARRRQIA